MSYEGYPNLALFYGQSPSWFGSSGDAHPSDLTARR
jgi:hypothetical protein